LAAKNAISAMVDDVDNLIADYMENEELVEFTTEATRVTLTMKKNRAIDDRRAAKVIGETLMAERSSVTMTMVDKLLKGTELTPEQKTELQALIYIKNTEPSVKTEVLPRL
jgi:hypothetical protein